MALSQNVLAVDASVGGKIRLRRNILRMTQSDLAKKLGVTFQQVQKYEKGTNRVSASRLHKVAEVLGLSVSELFDPELGVVEDPMGSNVLRDFICTEEGLRLNTAFVQISDQKIRLRLIQLVRVLGDSDPGTVPSLRPNVARRLTKKAAG